MPKFEKINSHKDTDFNLPKRKTKYSAGYDFEIIEDIVIKSSLVNIGKLLIAGGKHKINDNISEYEKKALEITELDQQEFIYELANIGKDFLNELIFDYSDVKNFISEKKLKPTLVPTGVKCHLNDNQFLSLHVRSSTPLHSYITMSNNVGIVDSDFYNNPDNEGHIHFPLFNFTPFDIILKKGDCIGQGIIHEYILTDDDFAEGERLGGFGSTK